MSKTRERKLEMLGMWHHYRVDDNPTEVGLFGVDADQSLTDVVPILQTGPEITESDDPVNVRPWYRQDRFVLKYRGYEIEHFAPWNASDEECELVYSYHYKRLVAYVDEELAKQEAEIARREQIRKRAHLLYLEPTKKQRAMVAKYVRRMEKEKNAVR